MEERIRKSVNCRLKHELRNHELLRHSSEGADTGRPLIIGVKITQVALGPPEGEIPVGN